jgi:hypothetical protein
MNTIPFVFIFINFLVGFVSDVILNFTNFVPSLKPYFKNKTVIESGVYAGITIVIALLIVMAITKFFLDFTVPLRNSELMRFLGIAFVVGYLADWYIYKQHVFGTSLDEYYKSLGVGHWGAIAFLFSILISYYSLKIYLAIL